MSETMTTLQLRRKIAGAKSYLSRLQNSLDNGRRASKPNHVYLNQLYNRVLVQQEKFQALCKELRARTPSDSNSERGLDDDNSYR